MRATGPRNALQARKATGTGHPEIAISSPLTSPSGRWELDIEGGTTQYGNFWMMVDYLADRYDNDDDPDDDETQPQGDGNA